MPTKVTFKNFVFFPQKYLFLNNSQSTLIISPNSVNWLVFLVKKEFLLRVKISSKCSPQNTKSNQIENSDQMHRRFPRLHAPLPIAFVSPDSEIPALPPDYLTRRMSGHSIGRFRAVNFVPLPQL